jgi:hypothetical protein
MTSLVVPIFSVLILSTSYGGCGERSTFYLSQMTPRHGFAHWGSTTKEDDMDDRRSQLFIARTVGVLVFIFVSSGRVGEFRELRWCCRFRWRSAQAVDR